MDDINGISVNAVDVQIQYYASQLLTPHGLLSAVALLGLLLFLIRFDGVKWIVLALMIYITTLGFAMNVTIHNVLFTPLQQIRALNHPIAFALLALLLVPTIKGSTGRRWKITSAAAVSMLIFELVFSIRFIGGGFASRGAFGAIVFITMFAVLALGLSRWLQGPEDVIALLRSILSAGALLVVGTSIQLVLNRSAIIENGRLFGTTNNPQTLGMSLALVIIVACYLLVRPRERLFWRLVAGAVVGIGGIFMAWSGSRMAMLSLAIALILLFRVRLRRLFAAALIVGVFAWIALQLFEGVESGAGHLLSNVNSRSAAWNNMWQSFSEAPMFGWGTIGVSAENSYLSVAACFGVFGLIPLAVMLVFFGREIWRVLRIRRWLGEYTLLADLTIGLAAMILTAAMFESYLISTITEYLVLLYSCWAMMAFLLDPAMFPILSGQQQQYWSGAAPADGFEWDGDGWAVEQGVPSMMGAHDWEPEHVGETPASHAY